MTKIEKLEKKYSKLCTKLGGLDEFGESRIIFVRYKQEEIALKNTINKLLAPVLEESNDEFKRIANENYALLK